ncbi:putative transmembrane amino acid transporter family protein [Monocercomonoides exilis]|uniref:putative transmembrane amino acid transporter family protein n=1 Tax=Monocercomonoides exilis TaxID=2049356 RepID=UPI0035593D3D|nr:putative transmembrane amino acid transporter family protein [Monocercomonoides exilis]|eukprot:MONOS_16425.1-p1 / transcript=MONOS_16425.1 / gene=MONOS_16425 / organism=Monocercomonoides_exilis_PA203 / gene_product=transmembrane amino acid transporter family protein / transcript_product=transmembrane amino acid transporter family protein / location=Mono_scaffold01723:1924-4532(+) / protein_length=438 / sequence_SO=supercontig / SO=protein_coding / is_pseudo=false
MSDDHEKEEEPLLRRASRHIINDEATRIHSTASLSSLVDVKIDKLANVPEVIMNTFKSFVGSGILGLPYGFSKGGWVLSLIAFPLASLVAGFCMMDLVASKIYKGSHLIRTYADCGREAFGNIGIWMVQITLISYQLGCCCSYMLIITQNLELLVPAIRQEYWVCIMVALFFIMSFIRSLKVTAILSLLANISLLVALILLIVGVILGGVKVGEPKAVNFRGFPAFFGIVLFAFEGAGLVLPIQGSMAKPKHYGKSLVFVLILVCLMNSMFGFINYWFLCENTPELITKSISDKYIVLRSIVTVFLVATLIVSFHLLAFPVFEAFDELKSMRRMKRRKPMKFWLLAYLARFLIICFTAIPSVTPLKSHFPAFVGLVGATFGSFLAFILPPLLHLKICWKGGSSVARKVIDIVVLCIMIPASIFVTVISVIDLVDTLKH